MKETEKIVVRIIVNFEGRDGAGRYIASTMSEAIRVANLMNGTISIVKEAA